VSQVLFFRGSAHWQAERNLPWYVNGTLEGEALEQLLQHLDTCASCRRELQELRKFQRSCVETCVLSDEHASFQRLRQRIEAERWQGAHAGWFASARRGWLATAAWLRWTLAAQFAVIVAIGGVLYGDGTPRANERAFVDGMPTATYRTLGDRDAGMAVAPSAIGPHLVVIFDPKLSQRDLNAMLQANRASIVSGPNDAGAYVLALPADRVANVQEKLRASPGVNWVQSLDRVGGR
jgi:hypothetical protein